METLSMRFNMKKKKRLLLFHLPSKTKSPLMHCCQLFVLMLKITLFA